MTQSQDQNKYTHESVLHLMIQRILRRPNTNCAIINVKYVVKHYSRGSTNRFRLLYRRNICSCYFVVVERTTNSLYPVSASGSRVKVTPGRVPRTSSKVVNTFPPMTWPPTTEPSARETDYTCDAAKNNQANILVPNNNDR